MSYYDEQDDEDYGRSHSQQTSCDRGDYAREMLQSGKWDRETYEEYLMGA